MTKVTDLMLATPVADLSPRVARNETNIMLNAFRIEMAGAFSKLNMVDGFADEFEDEAGIDTGAAANQTYDAAGDFYSNIGTSQVAQGAGTAIGDMDAGSGGLAAAFDGTTNQQSSDTAYSIAATSTAWIGKDWGAGNDRKLTKAIVYSASDTGFKNVVNPSITLTLEGSDTGAWGGEEVALGSLPAFTDTDGATIVKTIIATDLTTAYRYHRVTFTGATGTGAIQCAELEFVETLPALDMTLPSLAVTADTADPDTATVTLWEEDVDTPVLNTDLIAEVTRDGGTTWTAAALTVAATLGTGRILTGTADLSAQPAGTAMKIRTRTLNAKEVRVHAHGLEWR